MRKPRPRRKRAWAQLISLSLVTVVLLVMLSEGVSFAFYRAQYGIQAGALGAAMVALFALTGTPYTFKFLWSPIIDQLPLPLLGHWLGRRRAWLHRSASCWC